MGREMDENDKNLVFMQVEKAIVPPSGLIEHIKNHWWLVHSVKGLVFWQHSPQANSNKELTFRWQKNYPWAEVRFFTSVFRRINPHDYC